MADRLLENLWDTVRAIPPGMVSSYGDVGRALRHPAAGFQVGRWMAQCPDDVPWWRVVNKNGHLPIGKRSPELERLQQERLKSEGVEVRNGLIDMAEYGYIP